MTGTRAQHAVEEEGDGGRLGGNGGQQGAVEPRVRLEGRRRRPGDPRGVNEDSDLMSREIEKKKN